MTTNQMTVEIEQPDNGPVCVHYWLIDAPVGRVSQGTCQNCGEERKFKNWLERDADRERWGKF